MYNTDEEWKASYATEVKNRLYLTAFSDVVYADHFKQRLKERKIRVPTIKTLIYGEIVAVHMRNGKIERAIIEVKASEKFNRRFVIYFDNKTLIFVTTFLRYRKGE